MRGETFDLGDSVTGTKTGLGLEPISAFRIVGCPSAVLLGPNLIPQLLVGLRQDSGRLYQSVLSAPWSIRFL